MRYLKKIIVLLVLVPLVALAKPLETTELEIQVKQTPREVLSMTAQKYGLSDKLLIDIATCESRLNPKPKPNITEHERSYGLVQINLLAHPHITIEQAEDMYFASEFLAKNIKAGRGSMWSCYPNML